jgi:hypothetical protein
MEKITNFVEKNDSMAKKMDAPLKTLVYIKNTCGSSSTESVCSVVTYITFLNISSRPKRLATK